MLYRAGVRADWATLIAGVLGVTAGFLFARGDTRPGIPHVGKMDGKSQSVGIAAPLRISNLATASAGIVQLCGFRTEHCPPGVKTGDAISPPGGYVGGGMQMQVDVGIGPAGDVWVTNNWQYYPADLGKVDEAWGRAGRSGLLWHGQAGPHTDDRPAAKAIEKSR